MNFNRLFPPISQELKFVLSCTNEIHDTNLKFDFNSPIDWNKVLSSAISHGIFPLVHKRLTKFNDPMIPESVISTLRNHTIKNALTVLVLSEEIVRITNSMINYGIEPIILKGPPLSARIDEAITSRPSSDIDILVDPSDLRKASDILKLIGYKRSSPDFSLTIRLEKYYIRNDHHFEFFHPKRLIQVELHWRIRSFDIKHFPSASTLPTQKVKINGFTISTMEDEYWLMFLMIHGYNHMWGRLRWLYDIKELLKQNISLDNLLILAEKTETKPILFQTLILLQELFDVQIPDFLQQSVKNNKKAWQLSYFVLENLSEKNKETAICCSKLNFLNDYSLKKTNYYDYSSSFKKKVLYITSMYKPTEIEFKLIALPDFLFPLYYLIKPVYWVWRRILRQWFKKT